MAPIAIGHPKKILMMFTVYKTTNMVNGRFYIGIHKTNNPEDAYLGSGKILKRAVAKYGEESFVKEILFITESAQEAFSLEFRLVKENLSNPLCYNLRNGGAGGFDYINNSGLNGNNFQDVHSINKRREARRKRFHSDAEFRARIFGNLAIIRKLASPIKREESRQKAVSQWRGKRHTKKARENMADKARGNKNRLGFRWMNKGGEIITVRQESVPEMLLSGWEIGRKPSCEKPIKLGISKYVPIYKRTPNGSNWCHGHGEFLPVGDFHRDISRRTGLKKYCIACRKTARKNKAQINRQQKTG